MPPKYSRHNIPRSQEREERHVGEFCVPLARVPRRTDFRKPVERECPYEFVYAVGADCTNMVKFGFTRRLKDRLGALQNGNPFELRFLGYAEVRTGEARVVERACFDLAASAHVRNEWYRMGPDAAGLVIRNAISRAKVTPKALYGVAHP